MVHEIEPGKNFATMRGYIAEKQCAYYVQSNEIQSESYEELDWISKLNPDV